MEFKNDNHNYNFIIDYLNLSKVVLHKIELLYTTFITCYIYIYICYIVLYICYIFIPLYNIC